MCTQQIVRNTNKVDHILFSFDLDSCARCIQGPPTKIGHLKARQKKKIYIKMAKVFSK